MFLELNADINILQRSWKVDCDGTFDKDIWRKKAFGALWAEKFFLSAGDILGDFCMGSGNWGMITLSIKIFNT